MPRTESTGPKKVVPMCLFNISWTALAPPCTNTIFVNFFIIFKPKRAGEKDGNTSIINLVLESTKIFASVSDNKLRWVERNTERRRLNFSAKETDRISCSGSSSEASYNWKFKLKSSPKVGFPPEVILASSAWTLYGHFTVFTLSSLACSINLARGLTLI